jgi:hypothetical protein
VSCRPVARALVFAKSRALARTGTSGTSEGQVIGDGRTGLDSDFLATFWRPVGPHLACWSQIRRESVYGTEDQRFESSRRGLRIPVLEGFLALNRTQWGDNEGDNGGRCVDSGAAGAHLDAGGLRTRPRASSAARLPSSPKPPAGPEQPASRRGVLQGLRVCQFK